MHKKFNHAEIEKKWQNAWKESGIYNVGERDHKKEKEYILVEWPYPSGNLHMGHWFAFAVVDIYVRQRRMTGKQVLFPMGFDAFGLPAENAAIKRGLDPKAWTESNIEFMKGQLESMGNAFSWDKTTSSTDPQYYAWTQWMFTEFFKHGVAYRGTGKVNWCPGCNTVLANEQVLANGTCERSGDVVEQREMAQWMLRITDFADALTDDLETLSWPEHIKEAQKNWIGRSEGARITFPLNSPLQVTEVVFASNNQGKVARVRKLLRDANFNITLKTPRDIGLNDFDVIEDGNSLKANALKKARELRKHTSLPVLADDTGFFIENTEIDPITVKRNALAGVDEKTLTTEQIALKMQEYYTNIANEHGGSVDAEWRNGIVFIDEQGNEHYEEAIRPSILTNASRGVVDPRLPLRGLYKAKATGKYVLEQTEEEELVELRPITTALTRLLSTTVDVFTTRPDTLFGATYLVLAPEHPLVETLKPHLTNAHEVTAYQDATRKKKDEERLAEGKEKTGVKLEGVTATNPGTKEQIPVFIADYVIGTYGTGAIMAVPAHDERDFAFATKFELPISQVIHGDESQALPYAGAGTLVNSGSFNGLSSEEAKARILDFVGGKLENTYRLRDWSIGRQRYWGVPVPIVYDPEGNPHPIPKEHLPWHLPTDVDHTPTGEPPLKKSAELRERVTRIFGEGWTPEVETMDTFVDSSWYFLRYIDNRNGSEFSSKSAQEAWMPIDTYFGGAEHTTMHLLYSRFWQKALHKLGLVTCGEPYVKRINRGLILGPDGNKMSKSKGNVIDPDEQVKNLGADTVKMYLAFLGPYGEVVNYPWDMGGIAGTRRFLERVYGLRGHVQGGVSPETTRLLHKTIAKVTGDIGAYKFNTAISQLMIFVNHAEKQGLTEDDYRTFLTLLAPFAPHLTEELWHELGETSSIHLAPWPSYDPALLTEDMATISVQVNGKMRGTVQVPVDSDEATVFKTAREDAVLGPKIAGEPKRVIYVKNRILNLVL